MPDDACLPPPLCCTIISVTTDCGSVVETKLHRRGGYAFLTFAEHAAAVRCILNKNGLRVGSKVCTCLCALPGLSAWLPLHALSPRVCAPCRGSAIRLSS